MLNYIKKVCGGTSGASASAAGIFADIKANFKSVIGWTETSDGFFVCPHDKNAAIEFTMTETKADTTYLIKMFCHTRESETFSWVSTENSILSYTEGVTATEFFMTMYVSASGKTFSLGFSSTRDALPVTVIAGMCSGTMAFYASNILLCSGLSARNTTSGYCHNYTAIVDKSFDFYVATMINPMLGISFDELVKIVSTPYSLSVNQLFKSWAGSYRVISENKIGILVQGDH